MFTQTWQGCQVSGRFLNLLVWLEMCQDAPVFRNADSRVIRPKHGVSGQEPRAGLNR
ncbi:MAG: hypothetical protein Q4D62_03920 [Planctomycetia bacterium]|nr:hypothetical protein [Planctomycetia bacterium]